jgi:hypothetical protein
MTNWTFHWKTKHGTVVRKSKISASSILSALSDFHVERQRVDQFDRDGYVIERAESDHVSVGAATPRSFLASELPPRNPDAKQIKLTVAAEESIQKRIAERILKAAAEKKKEVAHVS